MQEKGCGLEIQGIKKALWCKTYLFIQSWKG